MLVTNVGQPFLQDGLILLFDLAEHHAHAIFAHIHDVAERGENCAAVKDAQSYPGACRERFCALTWQPNTLRLVVCSRVSVSDSISTKSMLAANG